MTSPPVPKVLALAGGGTPPPADRGFSARVGRLALTQERRPVQVPCGKTADPSVLATTSVWSTERVIVGATSEFLRREGDKYRFRYGQGPPAAVMRPWCFP